MGFGTAGSNLLLKKNARILDFNSSFSADFWKNRRIAIEANGISHRFMSTLPEEYQRMLATHHHEKKCISCDSAHFVANGFVRYFLRLLSGWKLFVPEPELYTGTALEIPEDQSILPYSIEIIGEALYAPKSNYDKFKAEKSRQDHQISESKGGVMPDCIMRLVFQKLQCSSISISKPPAEFDATAADRASCGFDVIVVSCDADIPLYPWSHRGLRGRIFFPHKNSSKLMCFDRDHKLKILQKHFGVDLEFLLESDDHIRIFEVSLLICALHLPHDYHFTSHDKAKYGYSNATGIGWTKLPKMMHRLATAVRVSMGDLIALQNQDVAQSLQHHIVSVKQGFPAKACAAALHFINQPVLQSTEVERHLQDLAEYEYVGSCSELCAHGYSVYTMPIGILEWRKMESPPKILTSDVLNHFETRMRTDNGASTGTYSALNEFLDMLPRIHEIPENSFECALVDVEYDPSKRQSLSGGNSLIAIRAKSPQSYGVKGKEKTEHREDAHYKPIAIVEVSPINGAVLADNGILWHQCICPNGMLCRHVKTMLLALSRFREEDYATNHTFAKYWQDKSSKKIQVSNTPLQLRFASTHRPFLNDILGKKNIGPEDLKRLFSGQAKTDIDIETGDIVATQSAIAHAQKRRRINRRRRSGSQAAIEAMDSQTRKAKEEFAKLQPDWTRLRFLCNERYRTTGKYCNFHRECDIANAHDILYE
eukprot:m.873413 g.873413  ORF g.873413 m.873413 type:complete len:709 (+) comp23572_c1_seq40:1607-3733(+)